jgi:SAM-dependent methyltransferase
MSRTLESAEEAVTLTEGITHYRAGVNASLATGAFQGIPLRDESARAGTRSAGTAPTEVSELYDEGYFRAFEPWRGEYISIADTLAGRLSFRSVLDLGCGNGFLLARLLALGKQVRGVDGSIHALASVPLEIRERVTLHDLTLPLALGTFDLVVCSEVAEHLEPCFAEALVGTICRHATRLVYFTAAVPGQGGLSHLNEQPHSYWQQKFSRRGFRLLAKETGSLREALAGRIQNIWWFAQNSMVFERSRSRPMAEPPMVRNYTLFPSVSGGMTEPTGIKPQP